VIVEDLWSDPVSADYVQLLRPAGLRSCWSMPIHGTGAQQVGVMTMFGTVPGRPEPRQWRLAQRLANLAGLIVAGAGARDGATVRIAAARAPEVLADLTEREADVLRLIALGHTNQEIAEQLYLSVRTVEAHRAALHRKLRSKRRSDLVQAALSGGLLHP
jgi:DNA-binding CsgD family transcriptional regulator